MQYQQGYYPVGSSELHYVIFGNGRELLFAFHGFGDTADIYTVLSPSFGGHYTVISIDLPFHGLTRWREGQPFTRDEVNLFVKDMIKKYNADKISVAGFSLGAKLALSVFASMPELIQTIWLFSPEGLKKNIWYSLAVYPRLGNKIFRSVLNKPKTFLGFAKFLSSIKLLSSSVNKFLFTQLGTAEKREQAWNIWMGIRGFEVPAQELKALLRKYNAKAYLFFGKYDGLITTADGNRFKQGLENVEVITLDKGHYIMKEYLNPYILQRLN